MTAFTLPVIRIRPAGKWKPIDPRELWAYRELVYYMVWRDIKVRYKQTVLGVGWALIQPVASMVMFTIVFGRLAQLPSDGAPYAVFTLAALLPWQLFSGAFNGASNSVASNAGIITKVYFPRLIIPIASVVATLVDFFVSLVLLGVVMVWYGVGFGPNLIFIPIFAAAALFTALAGGLWSAALNVKYRDIRYVLPYLLQLWLFASPVAYSITLVPEKYQAWYALNPLVGVIQGFRWALFGGPSPWHLMVGSTLVAAAMFAGGLFYFRKAEDVFSDLV
ncbi:MAG TPA: ABC transporter permease [Vicinamibacterales bacterium]|nr:ABC transporter permease [Vicinamibacterales bacterium]